MEFMRQAAARMRTTLKSSLVSLPLLSLSLPSSAIPSSATATSASASRYELVGTGVSTISVATYQANELIEDRWLVSPLTARSGYRGDLPSSNACLLAAVMDGHGGWQASEYTQNTLADTLASEMKSATDVADPHQVSQALVRAFNRTDRAFVDSIRGAFQLGFGDVAKVGCCALAAVASKDWVVVANSGDCRAVLGHVSRTAPEGSLLQAAGATDDDKDNLASIKAESLATSEPNPAVETLYVTALPLSNDHNARVPREVARLRAAHPGESDIVVCKSPSACYVKGRLQPTRAIGDAYLKYSEFNGHSDSRSWGRHIPPPYSPPYITSTPEVKLLWLSKQRNENSYNEPILDITNPNGDFPERHTFLILACDGVWDVLSNEDAVKFIAEDDGDAETVASRLIQHVLRKEAAASGMDVSQLMATPPGRRRRQLHDDLTAVILFLGDSGNAGGDVKGANQSKEKGWMW